MSSGSKVEESEPKNIKKNSEIYKVKQSYLL